MRANVGAPADQLGVRRRAVRAAPGEHDDRLEQVRLARGVRPHDQLRARPEVDLERGVAAKVAQRRAVEQDASSRRRRPPVASGRRADGHDDVDVLVVADRLEHARRERPVELERELVGVQVLERFGEVARVEGDRRAVALDRRLDLALVVADVRGGA